MAEEKETTLEDIAKELKSVKEEQSNIQALLEKRGTELGDMRKTVDDFGEKSKKLDEITNTLDKGGNLWYKGDHEENKGTGDESLEDLKARMSEDQWKAASEARERLSDDDRAKLDSDETLIRQHLQQAMATVKDTPGKSLFEKKEDRSGDDMPDFLKELWNKGHEESEQVPPINKDTPGAGGSNELETEKASSVQMTGCIPRPEQ